MKKVLLIATVQSHLCQFHIPKIRMLQKYGCEVHVAGLDNLSERGLTLDIADTRFNVPFARSPFRKTNITAYRSLINIIRDNHYDMICCHTPMGGIIGRFAAINTRRNGTYVLYTAHGFHFYKGAPIWNWLLYYPIEKYMAKLTDCLVTINEEDYTSALDGGFKTRIAHIHGMGVNTTKFKPVSQNEKNMMREKKGYHCDAFLILCVGELNKNKNQSTIIRAMQKVIKNNSRAKLLLAGIGAYKSSLLRLIDDIGLAEYIEFLGYRTDLEYYVNICDVVTSASIREGLGLTLLEGMVCEKPIVASQNRGHCELVRHQENGFLVDQFSSEGFADALIYLHDHPDKARALGQYGAKLVEPYKEENVLKALLTIYRDLGLVKTTPIDTLQRV